MECGGEVVLGSEKPQAYPPSQPNINLTSVVIVTVEDLSDLK